MDNRQRGPDARAALPRPHPLINRLVQAALAHRPIRRAARADLEPYVNRSLDALRALGAQDRGLAHVETHYRQHWQFSDRRAPAEVWCGEVRWPLDDAARAETPETVLYADSPWGRLPSGPAYRWATQTGVDHLTSHLYRWYSGLDYSEDAACQDQMRMMLIRRRPAANLAAVVIALGLWRHKQVPLTRFARASAQLTRRPGDNVLHPWSAEAGDRRALD